MLSSFRRLCVMIAGILWLAQGEGLAQQRLGFTVDGDPEDWGGNAGGFTARYNMQPVQINSIDIAAYDLNIGVFYRDVQDKETRRPLVRQAPPVNPYWEFVFLLRFLNPVFQDSAKSSVEVLFDVDADKDQGESIPPWVEFRPDYRFQVIGQEGRITQEIYHVWNGARWIERAGDDIPEFQAASSGRFLEGSIPWPAIGQPVLERHDPGTTERFIVKFAFRSRQGEAVDFLPYADEIQLPGIKGEWHPFQMDLILFTNITPFSWGRVKRAQ